MDAFISVIIPVYNVEEYLECCVESVASDPYPAKEIIMVNDGSQDRGGEICDELAKRYPNLVTVIHQTNQGLSVARNAGLLVAKGDYIFFVDSDDSVEKGTISLLAEKIKNHNYPDMLGFDYLSENEDGTISKERILAPPSFDTHLTSDNFPQILLLQHTAWLRIVKKSIYVDNNITFKPGVTYEDLCTTPKIITSCESVVYIPDVLYRYRKRAGSIMSMKGIDGYYNFFTVLEELISWFKDKDIFDKYYDEIVMLSVANMLFITSTPILNQSTNHPILGKQISFMNDNFPRWWKNPYLKRSTTKHKIMVFMRRYKLHIPMRLIWSFNSILKL